MEPHSNRGVAGWDRSEISCQRRVVNLQFFYIDLIVTILVSVTQVRREVAREVGEQTAVPSLVLEDTSREEGAGGMTGGKLLLVLGLLVVIRER